MKKKGNPYTFIVVVAALAAAAALVVANIDRISAFLEYCRRTGEDCCHRCRIKSIDPLPEQNDSDFEDVEV